MAGASDQDGSYAYTYDQLGRVLTVDNIRRPYISPVILTSAYDSAGNQCGVDRVIG